MQTQSLCLLRGHFVYRGFSSSSSSSLDLQGHSYALFKKKSMSALFVPAMNSDIDVNKLCVDGKAKLMIYAGI